jgi:DNA-binding response OmpR family regulator
MNKTLDTPTVLIVDENLGFIFWLGDIVTEAGYICIPALNSMQAISLVRELKVEIDLLIVNPALPGVSEMIQTLKNAQHSFQIVSSVDRTLDSAHGIHAEATQERAVLEPVARQKWLQRVRQSLRDVRSTIST